MDKRTDNRGEFYALFTYLSKAFACTPHELLIAKLDTYDCEKCSFHDYLSNRKGRVKVNEKYCSWSEWSEILFGVRKRLNFRTFTIQHFQM